MPDHPDRADDTLRPGPRRTPRELADRLGITLEAVARIRQATGLPPAGPDDPILTDDDETTFRMLPIAAALFGEGPALHFTRIVGNAMARVAEAAVSLFADEVGRPLQASGAPEREQARAEQEATASLEVIPPVMRALFHAQVEQAIRRRRRVADRYLELLPMTVGFVDLVGYTTLSRQLAPRELAALVDRVEALAADVVAAHDARLVKLIGDEIMFVAGDAATACEIACTLGERVATETRVAPRGGLATGPVLLRGGDYYGPIVNLAARIADLAVPGEILVATDTAREAAGAPFAFEPAGRRQLKGFDEPVPLCAVARRP